MHYCHSLLLGIRHLPKGFMFTQGSAPGRNESRPRLLILRILPGNRSHSSHKHFFIRKLETASYSHPLEPSPSPPNFPHIQASKHFKTNLDYNSFPAISEAAAVRETSVWFTDL